MKKSSVGAYGKWLGGLALNGPGPFSFGNRRFRSAGQWRRVARPLVLDRLRMPEPGVPKARVTSSCVRDGLRIEHLEWRLPWGPPVEAVLLKPAGARGRLPGVLALHCHGGNKFLGWRKVARGREEPSPLVRKHVEHYYEGRFWANELAKRGDAVLAHDVFGFASRRVRTRDVLDRVRGKAPAADPRTEAEIWRYNEWAAGHESVMAKALFDAGTTWPGVVLAEDMAALSVLAARPEVDVRRLGCGGLSGGGLRTVYLAGLDPRVKCAFCAGYMTTWHEMAVTQCWTNTWMVNLALLPGEMDFPEILGLRVPAPTLVLNTKRDQLYTLPGMKRAAAILRGIYRKAKAPERFRCSFYPGFHKLDVKMQEEAFGWMARWL